MQEESPPQPQLTPGSTGYITQPSMNEDFSGMHLGHPIMTNGAFFSQLLMDGIQSPLIVQTPTILSKNGIIHSNAKKWYADLMIPSSETVFIQWMENLESKCQSLLLANSDKWFEVPLDANEIETAFTPVFKVYKSGKYYVMRAIAYPSVRISTDKAVNDLCQPEEVIAQKTPLITLLNIRGVKFSARNFHLEMEMKQIMTVAADPFLGQCFLKIPKPPEQDETLQLKAAPELEKEDDNKIKKAESIPDLQFDLDILDLEDDTSHIDPIDAAIPSALEDDNDVDDGIISLKIPEHSDQHQELTLHYTKIQDRINLLQIELTHAMDESTQLQTLAQKYGITLSSV